jgi:hypothetical protein
VNFLQKIAVEKWKINSQIMVQMKTLKLLVMALGLGVAGVGAVLAATNPDEAAFEEFALQQVKAEGCKELPEVIRSRCPQFVQDNQAQIKKMLIRSTERENYVFFSIYRTNLSARSLVPELPMFLDLPAFHLETVGLFGRFHIYEAAQQKAKRDNRTSQ